IEIRRRQGGEGEALAGVVYRAVQNHAGNITPLLAVVELSKRRVAEEVDIPDLGERIGKVGRVQRSEECELADHRAPLEVRLHRGLVAREEFTIPGRKSVAGEYRFGLRRFLGDIVGRG